MAHLCRPHESPPDDFTYVQPETGGRWKADTLFKLVGIVVEHRQWKGLKPDDAASVRREIEAQICSGMPEGVCRGDAGEDYRPFDDKARTMSLESLMEFSAAAFNFVKSGGELVPRAESQRRAAICRGCRFNRPSPCVVCTPVFKMMEAMVPKDRVEPGLSACGICGCSLQAKILIPIHKDAHRYPSFCWNVSGGSEQPP